MVPGIPKRRTKGGERVPGGEKEKSHKLGSTVSRRLMTKASMIISTTAPHFPQM